MIGVAFSVVTHFINLLYIFPIGLGVLCGFLLGNAVYRLRLPSDEWKIAAAIVATMAIYGTSHYVLYLQFQNEASRLIVALPDYNNSIDIAGTINLLLMDSTGHTGFLGYLHYRAQHGFTIQPLYSDYSTPVGTTGAWLYWFLEIILTGGIAAYITVATTQQPFCYNCTTWYTGKHLGSVDYLYEAVCLELLENGNYQEAQKYIEFGLDETPSLEIYVQFCPSRLDGPLFLSVKRTTETMRGGIQLNDVLSQTITKVQYEELHTSPPNRDAISAPTVVKRPPNQAL